MLLLVRPGHEVDDPGEPPAVLLLREVQASRAGTPGARPSRGISPLRGLLQLPSRPFGHRGSYLDRVDGAHPIHQRGLHHTQPRGGAPEEHHMGHVKGILITAAIVLAVIVVDKKFHLSDKIAGYLPGVA
jgi:hypothetical protein